MFEQANILIDSDGSARLADFGLATIVRDADSLDNASDWGGITPQYTSPEVLRNAGCQSRESDVFSFGMVMFEVGDNLYAPCQIT